MRDALFSLFVLAAALAPAAAGAGGRAPGPRPTVEAVQGPFFVTSLRYATTENFLKKDVYKPFQLDRCWVRPELRRDLQKTVPFLKEKGLKLVFWDCLRPLAVQKKFWKLVPDPRYVADPRKGSAHNRGAAVDVTLADSSGRPLPMPTGFDDFSPRASPSYRCPPQDARLCRNRDLLARIMRRGGLKPLPTEWWHFQLPAAARYPLVKNLP